MLIKNKKYTLIFFLLSFILINLNLKADEFNISAKEIIVDKENEIIIGKGSVLAKDSEGKLIYADKITYKKNRETILAEGNVKIKDNIGNILLTDKASYDKFNEKITTYNNSELILEEGYKLTAKNILYNIKDKILESNNNSILTDLDNNTIQTTMFQYDTERNLFSSIGKIKIVDKNNNKYKFKEIYIDTKKKEMVGSNISVVLDEKSFGLKEENDPRFVANNILLTKDKTTLSKGVFTVCKIREDKCPPWSIKAKQITHDKIKKNIYYEHATLKLYDLPIFYFPKFYHPDPSVKRQSGFLVPFFTKNTTVGSGFALPYYWAINNDKDFTFAPKLYSNESPLLLSEYRQAFKNAFLTLDTGYFDGYENTSTVKPSGSQNHIFAELDINLKNNNDSNSDLSLKIQRTNNDTYFRKHSINTSLVNSEDTDLENEIKYSFSNEDSYLNITANVYENLRVKSSSRYEYILPNILFGKSFLTQNFGTIDFKSNLLNNNYESNKYKSILQNDLIWKSSSSYAKNGFVNSLEGMIRNTNYEAKNTSDYKTDGLVNEIQGVVAYKSSLPMKKNGINFSNLFSPNFMIRYAPGHMRDIGSKDTSINSSNLYSLNKTSEIEDGLSAILGFDFSASKNNENYDKFSLSLGQIFNHKENNDMPSKSSLDQKMSDIVGSFNYNFSEIGNVGYKFLLDNNLNDLNYSEISTGLNFGKVSFNLDYLEENKHVGSEHYVKSGITLNFSENNNLNFSTRKNFKTESTELYNISYQYGIDCLTAGLVYRREFYQDSELEPNDTLMFSLTFVPFGKINTPGNID